MTVPKSLKALLREPQSRAILPIFAVTCIMALLSFAGTASIQSLLPTEDVGRYTLVIALASMIGPLAALGQGGQIIRLYGREEPGTFNWPMDLARIMMIASFVVVLQCAFVFLLYKSLSTLEVTVVGLLAVLLALVGIAASVLRSHRGYFLAAALLRAPFALTVVVAVVAYFLSHPRLALILVGTSISFFIGALVALKVALARVPVGARVLTRQERVEGTAYVLWTLADIVGGYGEVALAGAILPPASVALYGVARNIVRVFDLARSSIDVALPTEIQKRRNLSLRRYIMPVFLIAAFLVLAHLVGAPLILSVLFRGRFNAASPVVLILALAGGLRLVHALAHSKLIVVDDSRSLKIYLGAGLITELVAMLVIAVMTMSLGIYGTAVGVCLGWLLRNLIAYGVLYAVGRRRS